MNEQINLLMPQARKKAKAQGYGSVQEYIEAAVREKTFDDLTSKEHWSCDWQSLRKTRKSSFRKRSSTRD